MSESLNSKTDTQLTTSMRKLRKVTDNMDLSRTERRAASASIDGIALEIARRHRLAKA